LLSNVILGGEQLLMIDTRASKNLYDTAQELIAFQNDVRLIHKVKEFLNAIHSMFLNYLLNKIVMMHSIII
jgi:hypothetical protein